MTRDVPGDPPIPIRMLLSPPFILGVFLLLVLGAVVTAATPTFFLHAADVAIHGTLTPGENATYAFTVPEDATRVSIRYHAGHDGDFHWVFGAEGSDGFRTGEFTPRGWWVEPWDTGATTFATDAVPGSWWFRVEAGTPAQYAFGITFHTADS